MRIVCAVHDYPPNRATGSGRFARQLCRALASRGHELVVVTSARPGRSAPAEDPGVRVVQIRRGARNGFARHVRHRLRGLLGEDRFGLATPLCSVIQERIRRARPDLVLAVAASTPAVVAAAEARRRLSLPGLVVPFYHIHAPDFVHQPRRWIDLLRSFDRVLAVTREEYDVLRARGVHSDRLERAQMFVEAPEPIAADEVAAWRRARGIGDALLVVAGGSYSEAKGTWALARASRSLPDVRFVLFGGDEAARRRLEAAVRVGPNLEFVGALDEREKARLLHAADLLAMPSRGDAFGLIYVEANACGTPALAADLPSMREVLGPDGTFIPLDDDAALVRAIRGQGPAAWRHPERVASARRNAARFTRPERLERLALAVERCAKPGPPAVA